MDRYEFFQHAFRLIVGKAVNVIEKTSIGKALESLGDQEKKSIRKQRPPGASPIDREFLELCIGCDACMAACPVNVIMIEDLERRDPFIYPDQAPCIRCPGFPCIASCPSGALDYKIK